jgi:glycosyltransferase involved in cell wall biosynthesis
MNSASSLEPPDCGKQSKPIKDRYLLLAKHPYYVDRTGGIWLERLWHQDFMLHTLYLHQLTLIAPRKTVAEATEIDLVKVDIPAKSGLHFGNLYGGITGPFGFLPRPLLAAVSLIAVMKDIDLVQPGEIHWPIGWIGCVFGLIAGKRLVVIVEAAPWRLDGRATHSLKRRLTAFLKERMARFLVNQSDVAFFTQPAYRAGLLTRKDIPNAVIPASWINNDDILGSKEATVLFERKKRTKRPRFLFAARLIQEKGVGVVLEAVDILATRNVAAEIDIIGAGPLRALCVAKAGAHGSVMMRVLDPVPYGEPFFALLREYDAVLVPSLSDEQPRIVFDAYSQGVPVIASDTDGLRPHVVSGRTGWLLEPGNPEALANQIVVASLAPDETAKLGPSALDYAHTHTHLGMHLERSRVLASVLT